MVIEFDLEGQWRSLEVIRGQWPSHKLGYNSKANDFQRKLIWQLLFYIKFPFKWYTIFDFLKF